MSDTPRTDDLVSLHDEAAAWVERTAGYNSLLEHARQLERELEHALKAQDVLVARIARLYEIGGANLGDRGGNTPSGDTLTSLAMLGKGIK